MLVTGHADGVLSFHNPSGHRPEAVAAQLPVDRFADFYAGRGIVIDA